MAELNQLEGDPAIDRRTFIKGAGLTAGAATIGASPQVSPIGRSQAIGFTAGIVIGAAVGAAGVALINWTQDDPQIDENDVLEDQLYNAAVSVAQGREKWEQQLQTQFVDRPTNQTPYANSAWQAVRTAATESIVNGGSQTDAEAAAIDAIDRQTTKSIVNVVERWNTAVKALTSTIIQDLDNGVGVLNQYEELTDNYNLSSVSSTSDLQNGGWNTIDTTTSSGNYPILKTADISPPHPADDIEGRDQPLELYGIVTSGGGWDVVTAPRAWGVDAKPDTPMYFEATHSDLSTQTILDKALYQNVLTEIKAAYDSITSDLSTYVGQLYNGLTEGTIDPANILSSQDILDTTANSSEQARMAAEIMAVGGSVPDNIGYQATISHPDLASDSLTGWIYPQYGASEPVPLAAGVTLHPDDYDLAYFGYESAVDDSFETRVLSGDKKLEVLGVEGVEDSSKSAESDSASGSVASDSTLTIWDESATDKQTPEPLTTPSDYDGWIVRVEAASGTTETIPIQNVNNPSSGVYSVTLSAISSGTSISTVSIEPGADYSQPVTSVSDATTVDTAETQALLEEQQKTIEELKAALNEDDPAAPGIGGLPTIPGWGLVGTGAAVILGFAGLNIATS